MTEDRRTFLKTLGLSALGAGVAIPVLEPVMTGAVRSAPRQGEGSGPAPGARQWAMVVDVAACLREDVRTAAAEACRRAHNVPRIPDREEEVHWMWTDSWEGLLPDQVHAHTPDPVREAPVLALCNHCTDPPCVKVCPTQATFKRAEDGIVMMDMHRCIGCRYCMAACPYGARSFNWRDPKPYVDADATGRPLSDYPTRTAGVVEKCTFCAERLRDGLQPACVEAVAALPGAEEALVFGDVSDPDSPVSRLLREKTTVCRKEELGTGPNVFYVVPSDLPALVAEGRV